MLTPTATLPFVFIFERHWDEAPKQLMQALLPKLAEEGYDTFCLEASQDLNESQILDSYQSGLKFSSDLNTQAKAYLEKNGIKIDRLWDINYGNLAQLMQIYVSSQRYFEVAEKIKQLPAQIFLQEIFNSAKRSFIRIKGIDIDSKDYEDMVSSDLPKRMAKIENYETRRIDTLTKNMLKLHSQGRGIIFACGALHTESLIKKFKGYNLEDRILYYFPHSNKRYDEADDIKDSIQFSNGYLQGHTFCMLGKDDYTGLADKIIKDIRKKNTLYQQEITQENSHISFLNSFFQTKFTCLMRPGYYVDALLDNRAPNSEKVKEKLQKAGISCHTTALQERSYLVIPAVNTVEVASAIRCLQA